ncbi:MAG: hypothetical protein PHT40_01520 [Patescibacteria group bacterium]|nr:hypothetical protein [Patescibacteria group bacterium]
MKTVKSLIMVLLFMSFVSVYGEGAIKGINQKRAVVDLSVAVTIGNNTYIPINFEGQACWYIIELLQVKDAFEKAHPELEVISWETYEHGQPRSGFLINGFIFGLWAHHKPRK